MRVCLDCPNLTTTGNRCPTHQRERERARGTSTQRGYGYAHHQKRAALAAAQAAGETFTCWRCGQPITGPFDLGHDDTDRTIYRGPEHPACNRATASRKTSPHA